MSLCHSSAKDYQVAANLHLGSRLKKMERWPPHPVQLPVLIWVQRRVRTRCSLDPYGEIVKSFFSVSCVG